MKEFKNYVVSFMDGEAIGVTREEGLLIVASLSKGNILAIRGSVYASHQFKSLKRIDKKTELDLYELGGVPKEQFATLYLNEALSTPSSNQKQING